MRRLGFALVAAALVLVFAGVAQAGTLSQVDANTLRFDADPGEANRIFVSTDANGVHVIDTGAAVTAGTGCTAPSANEGFCAATPKKQAALRLLIADGDQSDYVNVPPVTLPTVTIDGGAGGDELIGGGAKFNNFVDGGPGADTFEGPVTVDYHTRTDPLTVTVGDDLANDGEAGEGDLVSSETVGVDAGEGDDTLTVLDSAAVQQRTRLEGGDGSDHLSILRRPYGGYIHGGTGPDVIHQEAKVGLVYGANGDDLIFGGKGNQSLEGAGGDDTLRGLEGADHLFGNRGADVFLPGPGRDSVGGGHGPDTIFARDGQLDHVNGGAGKDDRARVDRGLDVLSYVEELF
jgi:Ca2+-binding RTX toxin-like protein